MHLLHFLKLPPSDNLHPEVVTSGLGEHPFVVVPHNNKVVPQHHTIIADDKQGLTRQGTVVEQYQDKELGTSGDGDVVPVQQKVRLLSTYIFFLTHSPVSYFKPYERFLISFF